MNSVIRLKVSEIIGSNLAVSSDDGDAVFQKLKIALDNRRSVELDFSGIEMVISAFLNAAVGRLVETNPIAELNEQVTYKNLSEDDRELVHRVMENAVRFYEDPDRFKKALESGDNDEE